MYLTESIQWPKEAIVFGAMATRGEKIRRARRAQKLTIKQLADAVGVGERTLGRMERDETTDPRTAAVVEAHLGLDTDESARGERPLPRLDEATPAELAFEFLRRMEAAAQTATSGVLPPGIEHEPDSISGPPVRNSADRAESGT